MVSGNYNETLLFVEGYSTNSIDKYGYIQAIDIRGTKLTIDMSKMLKLSNGSFVLHGLTQLEDSIYIDIMNFNYAHSFSFINVRIDKHGKIRKKVSTSDRMNRLASNWYNIVNLNRKLMLLGMGRYIIANKQLRYLIGLIDGELIIPKYCDIYTTDNAVYSDNQLQSIVCYGDCDIGGQFPRTPITSVKILGKTNEIKDCAFVACFKLSELIIKNNLKSIGGMAFAYCESLKNVTLPEYIECIGASAFRDTHNLVNLEINEVKCISDRAFANSGIEKLKIKKSIEIIGTNAFRDCKNLRKLELPNGLFSLGVDVFAGCTNLEYVYLPRTTTIVHKETFNGVSLKKLVAPRHLKDNLFSINKRIIEYY